MLPGQRVLPPSRRDKKQIIAHLDPVLVEAVHLRRKARGVTAQEIIAQAVNEAVAQYGRPPILKVGRHRVVKRRRGLAKVQSGENNSPARAGTRRVAAWFDSGDVQRVVDFGREVGRKVQDLVDVGLRKVISDGEMAAAREAVAPSQRQDEPSRA